MGNDRVIQTPTGLGVVRNDQVLAFNDCVTLTGSLLFSFDPDVTAAYYQAFSPNKSTTGALAQSA